MANIRTILVLARDGVVNGPLASPLVPRPARRLMLRALGYDVHRTACISARCFIGSRRVVFRAGSFANIGCFFDGNAEIVVGSGVQLGMHTMFVSATHEISEHADRRAGVDRALPIRVGDGSWIGARCTIMAGVEIGQGCVIGAGSLVVSDCREDSLYLGSPARLRRELRSTAAATASG